jgi:hypothetical protein
LPEPGDSEVHRLTAAESLLVVLRPRPGELGDAALRKVRDRLADLYGELLPHASVFARWDRSRTHIVAGLTGDDDSAATGLTLWGLPVGAAGEATSAELTRVAVDPAAARDLLGVWILLVESDAGVRLVTGSDLVHTLVRAEGPDGVAWGTKGLAALDVAGAPRRIAMDRIPELIAFDYVLGDDELLEGTRVLEEASVVDSDQRGERISSYWPVEERFAPGPPTDAARLREVLSADILRLAAVPGVHVAFTAGRDSTLVASCLREHGVVLPTFTMGFEGFPDVMGARAAAEAWGAPHRVMTGAAGVDFARAVHKSAWAEGMDIAWNLVGTGLVWDGPQPMVWLAGSGGEIGRAFYWQQQDIVSPSPDKLVAKLLHEARPACWNRARPVLIRRVSQALGEAAAPGREGWARLDVFYARGRMRKWLMRTTPRPEARGLLAAYTSPSVVRALLDIPEAARLNGSVFDEALALGEPNLHRIAQAAIPARPALLRPTRSLRGKASRVVPAPVRRALRSRSLPEVPGDLGIVLAQLPKDLLCREVMGNAWWRETVRAAVSHPRPQHLLWNALAVEALALRLAES